MTDEQYAKVRWLYRAKNAEKKLNALYHKRECDRERAKRLARALEGAGTGRSDSRSNVTEESIFKLLGSGEEYEKYFSFYLSVRREIEDVIKTLGDPVAEAVFTQKYLNYMTMEEIAEKMNCSVKTVKRKHGEGLEKMSPNALECPLLM